MFSTLHTNSAAGAIPRLLDMGVEPFLLSATLVSVLAQRLVRSVCKGCGAPVEPDAERMAALGLTGDDLAGARLKAGAGCSVCRQSGYRGRQAVFEYLHVDSDLRKLIAEGRDPEHIEQTARAQGQGSLRDDALAKLKDGRTTLAEVMRVVA